MLQSKVFKPNYYVILSYAACLLVHLLAMLSFSETSSMCLKNAHIFLKEKHKAVMGAASSGLILKLDNKPP